MLPRQPPLVPLDPAKAFAAAFGHFEAGRLAEARNQARRLEKAFPRFGGVYYLLGLIALAEGEGRQAAQSLKQALLLARDQPAAHRLPLHMAMARAQAAQGRWAEALADYDRVLELAPADGGAQLGRATSLRRLGRFDEAEALYRQLVSPVAGRELDQFAIDAGHDLAALLLERARPAEALPFVEGALVARPGWPLALGTLAAALVASGRAAEALAPLAQALAAESARVGLHLGLAQALFALSRWDEAVTAARQAVALEPNSATGWRLLGLALGRLGGGAEAAKALARAADLDPSDAHARFQLAEILRQGGATGEAAALYRAVLALDPDDRHGAVLGLALLGEAPVPERAPDPYVRALFDGYAERFDLDLTGKLAYRGPQKLLSAFGDVLPAAQALALFDIGCGTGLGGLAFKPLTEGGRLDGIDLSPRMVEKARQRGIYDELLVGDLVVALRERPGLYDLVLAADVFVYLGDLEPSFAAAAQALKPGGHLVFSVERWEGGSRWEGGEPYHLGDHARYAHSAAYLRNLAASHGFAVAQLDEGSTRLEGGAAVPGLLAVLRKL